VLGAIVTMSRGSVGQNKYYGAYHANADEDSATSYALKSIRHVEQLYLEATRSR
jgi:hypothetical protein